MNLFTKSKYRIQKREDVGAFSQFVAVLIAFMGALLVSAVLIRVAGANVMEAFASLWGGAFGGQRNIIETLVKATPLLLTGLATAIAFKGKIWSIGQEGQLFAGAIMSYWAYVAFEALPRIPLVAIVVVAGFAGGAIAGLIPGLLKAYFNVDEIISTVMGNYIITYLLSLLLSGVGPWREEGSYYQQTAPIAEKAHFPLLIPDTRLHMGFVIALVVALIVYFILKRTPLGFEIRSYGSNPTAARFKGINIARVLIVTMLISGGIAGLAGVGELFGIQHRLRPDLSPGYGYTGIIVAMLAGLEPLAVMPSALLFGALLNGSVRLRIITGVPTALTYAIQTIILLFLLSAQVLARYRLGRVEIHD